MWRFVLLGLLPVSGLLAVIVLDDLIAWSSRLTVPLVIAPRPPVFVPSARVPETVLTPLPDPTPIQVSPTYHLPETRRAIPPVWHYERSAKIDLRAARDLIDQGKTNEAKLILIKVQLRMVLQPVTPDRPNRDDVNTAASQLRTAVRALETGNPNDALRVINSILSTSP